MEPKLVIVIGTKGVRLIRLVASCESEEKEALDLYLRLKNNLRAIDKTLRAFEKALNRKEINNAGAEL
jgi:hypothetical protein